MIRVFSMFTGYGGAEWGLKLANIPYECVGWSEINKDAIKIFEMNFPENAGKNFGDCKKIDPSTLPDFDLLTGGFPCQDVSIAGERDLTKGRTMLINDVFRILEAKKPKWVVLENVQGLLSTEPLWTNIKWTLKKLGYGVCYKLLNSKEHGVPQNRPRVFIVCQLGGWDFMEFQYPPSFRLEIFVKDILEKEVSEKYWLKPNQVESLLKHFENQQEAGNGFSKLPMTGEVSSSLMERDYKDGGKSVMILDDYNHTLRNEGNGNKVVMLHNTYGGFGEEGRVFDEGYSPAIRTPAGGGHLPVILDLYNKKAKDDGTSICLTEPHHNNLRVMVEPSILRLERTEQGKENRDDEGGVWCEKELKPRPDGISNALTSCQRDNLIAGCLTEAQGRQGSSSEFLTACEAVRQSSNQIRRLTPRECFRLMGFLKDEINLDGLSDTALYRLAGNGWDVHLASLLFKQMPFGKLV